MTVLVHPAFKPILARLLIVFLASLSVCGADAEILSPASINGSYAMGGNITGNGSCTTTNLGGSTANTNATANLTGLGTIGPYSFNVTASVVRGTSSNAVWSNGVCFPTANAMRFQTVKVPTTANGADGPGYGSYEFSFSQGVRALSFRINGLDYGDYAEIFAYNGAAQVAVPASYITPDASLTSYTPFVNRLTGGATDSNAIGYLSPENSGALSLVLTFPLATTVTRVVVRYGKAQDDILAATSFFDDFKWDVETKVRVQKISAGATGSFAFSAATNLASIPANITTSTAGVAAPVSPAAINVTASANTVTITEAAASGYSMTGFSCADANSASTGNPASFGSFVTATRVGTIPAINVKAGADITCRFTNTKLPTLRLTKISNGSVGTFNFTGGNGWSSQNITTATPGTGVTDALQTLTAAATATTITEAFVSGFAMSGVSCAGTGGGTQPAVNLTNRTFAFNTTQMAAGSNITCTVTNTIVPPGLSILKSHQLIKAPGNTNAGAEVGDTINYSYVVTNTGGQLISNLDVSDVHSGAGSFADPTHTTLTDNGTTGDSPDSNPATTVWGTIAPQDVVRFASSYVVVQQDLDAQ